ncbi:hypothetical protein CKO42_21650 [Lamprobacter modestohalophilus]|uniref:Uncharacterized protein n=1 Tax=Lamprobacter modestohalophilus TaxID=1064514 RepID=A0A9X0WCJ9_9GAMM|nr:hypothetical protein [Lamprobacter modestohalophilus]MBK1620979.1 hypothetical protein [Lamprobacter modestohalophilus]
MTWFDLDRFAAYIITFLLIMPPVLLWFGYRLIKRQRIKKQRHQEVFQAWVEQEDNPELADAWVQLWFEMALLIPFSSRARRAFVGSMLIHGDDPDDYPWEVQQYLIGLGPDGSLDPGTILLVNLSEQSDASVADRAVELWKDLMWALCKTEAEVNDALRSVLERLPQASQVARAAVQRGLVTQWFDQARFNLNERLDPFLD